METTRKGRENSNGLEVVKAAAWAWHEHGSSGSLRRAGTREYEASRSTTQTPRPSRYKLESLRIQEKDKESQQLQSSRKDVHHHRHENNTLLDSYEIKRISNQLEGFINSSSSNRCEVSSSWNGGRREMRRKKKLWEAFIRKHAVVCGREDDVMESQVLGCRPERYVPVVKLAICKPNLFFH